MADIFDGPMLVGIAALISSAVNLIHALRPPERPRHHLPAPQRPTRRKRRKDRPMSS